MENKIKKGWDALKQKFNNTYVDVKLIQEVNKRGVKVIY